MLYFLKLYLKSLKLQKPVQRLKINIFGNISSKKSATTLYTHFPSVSFYQCLHKIKLGGNKNPSGEYLKLFLR
jgi:hypothetical protein